MSAYNFVRSGPNFTKNFLFNAQSIALVNAVYMLSLSSSVPEIFALKLENCHKSHRFLPSQIFRGAMPPKVVPALTPPPRDTSIAKVSLGYTP